MKKIAIIGPESTGKSTLCQQLASHYNTLWCPEYAREYLLQHGKDYSYDDLLTIAKGQVDLEDDCIERLAVTQMNEALSGTQKLQTDALHPLLSDSPPQNKKLLVIDTDMIVLKVWCDFVFGKCHPFILEQLEERKYDLYLLCNADLPWVKDELREYPDFRVRENLFEIFKEIMQNQTVPWVSIKGNYRERLHTAISAIDRLLLN